MVKKSNYSSKVELRRQAEAKWSELKKRTGPLPSTELDVRRLVHELQVHQIELEMQNEELMQARAELEAALRQYTDLYDFAPAGYFTLARDGAIRQVNLTGANLLGVERGKLIKRRFGVFISAQSLSTFNTFLAKVFTSQQMESCEVALQQDDSVPLWVRIEANSDSSLGQPEECNAVVRNITDRMRAEEEIQNLARFPSENPDPILRIAQDGTLLYINEAGLSLLAEWHLQVGQASPPMLRRAVIQSMNSGKTRVLELEYGERVYSFHVVPIIATGYVNLYSRDITERVQADELLRESETRFKQVWEATSDAMALSDSEGIVLDANPAYFDLYRYTPEQVIGQSFAIIFPDENRKEAVEQYKAVFASELIPPSFEATVWRADGSEHVVESRATFISKDGRRTAMLSSIRDITERKRAEEELKHLSTHDELTGLYNRSFFIEEMARLERGREFPISIVMADVDRLKETNDQHGHAAGDALLKRVAQVLTAAYRAEDVVARIGGDEFAVLLPNTDATAAEVSLQRVRQVIQEVNAAHPGTPIRLSFDASTAEKPTPLSNVLKEADENMYRRKRGRDAS